MILNALFPVLLLLCCGVLLKRWQMISVEFTRVSDRLVYYFFFPAMLFHKIGGAPLYLERGWQFILAAILAIIAVFGISLVCIYKLPIARHQAGSFSQACYRFNTYIGMAVIINAFGDQGARLYSILAGLLIPGINVMAVSVLIWNNGDPQPFLKKFRTTCRHLITNPLILGCLAGMLYARGFGGFPEFIDNSLKLLSQVSLPLALFSVGSSLSFYSLKQSMRLAVLAGAIKLALLPGIGCLLLRILGVTGMGWNVAMLFFTLPTSTAIYILSSQLNSDTELASAAIVVSTILSFFSMSLVLAMAH